MRRFVPLCTIVILLAVTLFTGAPTVVAQDDAPVPDGSPAPAPGIFLPIVVGYQQSSPPDPEQGEIESTFEVNIEEALPDEVSEKSSDSVDDLSEGEIPPEPGLEVAEAESAAAKPDVIEEDFSIEPAEMDGWTTIMSEGFEGAFPSSSAWRVLDSNGATNGHYYWDDESYKPYSGYYSAWPAGGGPNALNPRTYNYPNNMRSFMIYGPFNLSNAADAELLFTYWNQSEANYDHFSWLASTNGSSFYGYKVSGNSGGWRNVNFDLRAVPTLGNLMGRSSVWIAFHFSSDYSITNKGPFVDNIRLQKLVNTVTCPGQYKAEYFNNRTLSGSPAVTRCEGWPINRSWGNGSPVSGIGSDNFSVRWSGTANFAAGSYNFQATADDGIRVSLNGSRIIDGWRDQATTTYRATRTLSGGNYSVVVEYYEAGGGAVAQFQWAPTVPSGIPGIVYSTSGDFHIFKVDMRSPNLTFETVMANDVRTGQSTAVEYVSDMVRRSPYAGRNPVLAINADYFGAGHHGAEGLTVKNGTRLPNAGSGNGAEWVRSSLSISRDNIVRIGRQTDCSGTKERPSACSNWTPDANRYHTTVGGGPLFIVNKERVGGSNQNSVLPCSNESPSGISGPLATRFCNTSIRWTAAGVSGDGRYLFVVVSGVPKTMDEIAVVLIAQGAYRAIKFDGGSSTQLWYKPKGMIVSGNRVANALVVFSSQ